MVPSTKEESITLPSIGYKCNNSQWQIISHHQVSAIRFHQVSWVCFFVTQFETLKTMHTHCTHVCRIKLTNLIADVTFILPNNTLHVILINRKNINLPVYILDKLGQYQCTRIQWNNIFMCNISSTIIHATVTQLD